MGHYRDYGAAENQGSEQTKEPQIRLLIFEPHTPHCDMVGPVKQVLNEFMSSLKSQEDERPQSRRLAGIVSNNRAGSRPLSATAMEIVSLCTSKPTKRKFFFIGPVLPLVARHPRGTPALAQPTLYASDWSNHFV